METKRKARGLVALLLMLTLLLSTYLPFMPIQQVEASITTGSSGSISSAGSVKGYAGGIGLINKNIFRVGLITEGEYRHNGTAAQKAEMYERVKHRVPWILSPLYFIPNENYYSNFNIARYSQGNSSLVVSSQEDSKRLMFGLNKVTTKPANVVGNYITSNYDEYGTSPKRSYESLKSGGWGTLLNTITFEQAVTIWAYILGPTVTTSSQSTYDISTRLDKMVASDATMSAFKAGNATREQEFEIYRGYLGLLVSLVKLIPGDMGTYTQQGSYTTYKDWWYNALNQYVDLGKLRTENGAVTIAIDTAVEVKWTGSATRMYLGAYDYQFFYASVQGRNLPYGDWKDYFNQQASGDWYKLYSSAVGRDMLERQISRISDVYNEGNVFSHGEALIEYPNYRLRTSPGVPQYTLNGTSGAIIDSLTFYSSGGNVARGYILATFIPPTVEPTPTHNTGDPEFWFQLDADLLCVGKTTTSRVNYHDGTKWASPKPTHSQVVFTSSDNNKASINGTTGVITGKAPGIVTFEGKYLGLSAKTKITIQDCGNNGGGSAKLYVTLDKYCVGGAPSKAERRISDLGYTSETGVQGYPANGKFTMEIADTSVIQRVDDFTLKALKVGTTKVTFWAHKGEGPKEAKTVMTVNVTDCNGGTPPTPPPTEQQLELILLADKVCIGRTVALEGIYLPPTGNSVKVTTMGEWTSSMKSVATVKNGAVTGVGIGTTTITLIYLGLKATANLDVVDCTGSNPGEIVTGTPAIKVKVNPVMCIGGTEIPVVTYTRTDGSVHTIQNKDIKWTASNDNLQITFGTIYAAKNTSNGGKTTVTAVYEGATYKAQFTILDCSETIPTPVDVTTIDLDFQAPGVCIGSIAGATVTVKYSNGTERKINPREAVWTTSTPNLLHVKSPNIIENGLISGKAVGTASVTVSLGGKTVTKTLQVEDCPQPDIPDNPAPIEGDPSFLIMKPQIKLEASPKDRMIRAGSEIIGEKVTLNVKHLAPSTVKNNWIGFFKFSDESLNKANQTVKVQIEWSARKSEPTAEFDEDIKSADGKNYTDSVEMTREEFLKFIGGDSALTFYDNVITEPIDEGTGKKFTYGVTLSVYATNQYGEFALESVESKDYASFFRPKNPPEYMGVTTDVQAYSEIKEGKPNEEKFEAMSGVPSNKKLYFATGGKEFVVDVELEYIKNASSVWRTYRSYYSGTASEFKAGDNAGTASLGGQTVDLHNGGTYTKTWTGSREWTGKVTYSDHTTSVENKWSDDAFNAALKEAEAYAKEVNATVLSHTSASDKIRRAHKGWSATVTHTKSDGAAGWANPGQAYKAPVPCSGNPCTGGSSAVPYIRSSGANGTAGSYSITVTFTVPAKIVDGPDSTNDMPGIEDNWRQNIQFDYVKIIRADVYRLVEGRLDKTSNVLGPDTLRATIQSGNHTVWSNIAQDSAGGNDIEAQSSKHGRLRYTLEENQHDTVSWNEGVRTNKSDGMGRNGVTVSPDSGGTIAVQGGGHNNSWAKGILYTREAGQISDTVDAHKSVVGTKTAYSTNVDSVDMATPEWKKFDERRKLLNRATVVSDFLILQTSSGDMSVMYFQKDSETKKSQEQFGYVESTKQEMWDDNPLSGAKWSEKEIPNGSYNGHYNQAGKTAGTNQKYWGEDTVRNQMINNINGGSTGNFRRTSVSTRLDNTGVGVNGSTKRAQRPTRQLLIYTQQDIIPTTPNARYVFGKSTTFYEHLYRYSSNNAYALYPGVELRPFEYTNNPQPLFENRRGFVLETGYTKTSTIINDIIIHTPVSVQDATIIGLPSYLDQRTETPLGGAAAMIDKENFDRVAAENGNATPNMFIDAIKRWTTARVTVNTSEVLESTISITGQQVPSTTQAWGYTGGAQTFIAPATGEYTFELWGAEGGPSGGEFGNKGGAGGYAKGVQRVPQGAIVQINVGGQNGFNGGGAPSPFNGGGATDIRIDGSTLDKRIIVAGGGGGGGQKYGGIGGAGGGYQGIWGTPSRYASGGNAGTSTEGGLGGAGYSGMQSGSRGTLGQGGSGGAVGTVGGGGGGGYYGGGGGGADVIDDFSEAGGGGGGGGSSYVGRVYAEETISGNNSMPSPYGGWQVGHRGNGYARITSPPVSIPSSTEKLGVSSGTHKNSVSTTFDTYFESGDPNAYKDYTWEQLFGQNWRNYVKTTNKNEDIPSSSTKTKAISDGDLRIASAKVWNFDNSTEGYHSGNGHFLRPWDGIVALDTSQTADANFYSPVGLNIQNVSKDDYVVIRVKNNSNGTHGQLYYQTSGHMMFAETGVVHFTMTPSDNEYKTYVIRMDSQRFSGTLQQLRFDLGNGASYGNVEIDYIKYFSASLPIGATVKAWNFDNSTEGYHSGNGHFLRPWDGIVALDTSQTADAHFHSPEGLNIQNVSKYDSIEIRLRNNGGGPLGQIYYRTSSHMTYAETGVVNFSMTSWDTEYKTYVIKMDSPNFNGTLHQLRFDLGNGALGNSVEIDSIKYISANAPQVGVSGPTEILTVSLSERIDTHSVDEVKTETTSVDVDAVRRDLRFFPDYMHDGTYNPVKAGFGFGEVPKSVVNTPIPTAGGGTVQVGTFILLDHEFQVFFPNIGDFSQQPDLHGILSPTTARGMGYTNGMNTAEYTRSKFVTFSFDVIHNGVTYTRDTKIPLALNQDYYTFYSVLSNNEAMAAEVRFQADAINYDSREPDGITNKLRSADYTARSTAFKKSYIDIVGRIGNFTITDTEDFRFSSLFKTEKPDGRWLVDGLIREVDITKQNKFFGDAIDIKGNSIVGTEFTKFGLNTYGTQVWSGDASSRLNLPINPSLQPKEALRNEFLKVGYDLFGSIQTTGDYGNGAIRILPYYYRLDLKTGALEPLDVYRVENNSYVPVNRYRAADNGFVPPDIDGYPLIIDWEEEAPRFNYTVDEAEITALASKAYGTPSYGVTTANDGTQEYGITSIDPLMTPRGSYINIGNSQRVVLDSTARTFIGNTETYGQDKNPATVLRNEDYYYHGQKWYLKLGLPAASVFVKTGEIPNLENINKVKDGNAVLLMTTDIIAMGDMYTLKYNQHSGSFSTFKDGVGGTFNFATLIENGRLSPIIALYDLEENATVDVSLQGSH